jgi:hypothetical protein
VEERAILDTLLVDEVRIALEKVYQVLQVHEMYEYQVTQYDKQTGQGRLFVQYINTFLKLLRERRLPVK